MAQAAELRTGDRRSDLEDPQLMMLNALTDKLSDEIIARLAELGESKVGRLTFHFAHLKLKQLQDETKQYTRFVVNNGFREKRNYDISHKELPERWTEHKFLHVPYRTLVRGIALSLRLMKRIDAIHVGPRAKYQWYEMRRRRYPPSYPAKRAYGLLPYVWLNTADRMKVIQEETRSGSAPWKDMTIKISGVDRVVKTYGELGALIIDGQMILLDESFIELTSIDGL